MAAYLTTADDEWQVEPGSAQFVQGCLKPSSFGGPDSVGAGRGRCGFIDQVGSHETLIFRVRECLDLRVVP